MLAAGDAGHHHAGALRCGATNARVVGERDHAVSLNAPALLTEVAPWGSRDISLGSWVGAALPPRSIASGGGMWALSLVRLADADRATIAGSGPKWDGMLASLSQEDVGGSTNITPVHLLVNPIYLLDLTLAQIRLRRVFLDLRLYGGSPAATSRNYLESAASCPTFTHQLPSRPAGRVMPRAGGVEDGEPGPGSTAAALAALSNPPSTNPSDAFIAQLNSRIKAEADLYKREVQRVVDSWDLVSLIGLSSPEGVLPPPFNLEVSFPGRTSPAVRDVRHKEMCVFLLKRLLDGLLLHDTLQQQQVRYTALLAAAHLRPGAPIAAFGSGAAGGAGQLAIPDVIAALDPSLATVGDTSERRQSLVSGGSNRDNDKAPNPPPHRHWHVDDEKRQLARYGHMAPAVANEVAALASALRQANALEQNSVELLLAEPEEDDEGNGRVIAVRERQLMRWLRQAVASILALAEQQREEEVALASARTKRARYRTLMAQREAEQLLRLLQQEGQAHTRRVEADVCDRGLGLVFEVERMQHAMDKFGSDMELQKDAARLQAVAEYGSKVDALEKELEMARTNHAVFKEDMQQNLMLALSDVRKEANMKMMLARFDGGMPHEEVDHHIRVQRLEDELLQMKLRNVDLTKSIMKLRAMFKLKQAVANNLAQKKIENMELTHRAAEGGTWETAQEHMGRARQLAEQLTATRKALGETEDVLRKVSKDLGLANRSKVRLVQWKVQTSQQMSALESQVKKLERYSRDIDKDKDGGTSISGDAPPQKNALARSDSKSHGTSGQYTSELEKEVKRLQRKLAQERQLKSEALEKLAETRPPPPVGDFEGAQVEMWQKKYSHTHAQLQQLAAENDELKRRMREAQAAMPTGWGAPAPTPGGGSSSLSSTYPLGTGAGSGGSEASGYPRQPSPGSGTARQNMFQASSAHGYLQHRSAEEAARSSMSPRGLAAAGLSPRLNPPPPHAPAGLRPTSAPNKGPGGMLDIAGLAAMKQQQGSAAVMGMPSPMGLKIKPMTASGLTSSKARQQSSPSPRR